MNDKPRKLLIDEPPLQVLPTLACIIGLNEALVLQQLHYWLRNAETQRKLGVYEKGRWWIYDTYEQWQENFPFWSVRTIERIFDELRAKRIVITEYLAPDKSDRTLYYTIDYDQYERVVDNWQLAGAEMRSRRSRSRQVGEMGESPASRQVGEMGESPASRQVVDMDSDNLATSIVTDCPDLHNAETSSLKTTERLRANSAPANGRNSPAEPGDPPAASLGLPIQALHPKQWWEMTKQQLEMEMQKNIYDTWVKPVVFTGWEEGEGVITLAGHNLYACEWVKSRCGLRIERLLSAIANREVHANIIVGELP